MVIRDGRIDRVRVAVNGVAPFPVRLLEVEDAVRGQPANEETARTGGEVAIRGTRALRHNDYKIALMRNLVTRALRIGQGA